MNKATTIRRHCGAIAAVLLLGALSSGCATIKTGSHQDESVSFSNYRTFAWIADDPLILGVDEQSPISPLSQKIIIDAIEDELINNGFSHLANPDQADFIVSYTVGTREKIVANSFPSAYRGTWSWHMHSQYNYSADVVHRSYTEGTLGIDIFDGSTKQPVWHGWATKTILTSDRENPSASIQKAVAGIIERFPTTN